MQIAPKVLKARYSEKLGIPQAVSCGCFETKKLPSFGLITL
jgi:hypothetical protein